MEALIGTIEMISASGTYNAADVESFIGSCEEFGDGCTSHTVVSIIGPQSSGKSYLLNCVFGTKFGVMDASSGRTQTTKGIWLAKCINPSILVMDVEGSDGLERGGENTSFENQSALFSLVVSDVVLVNMWLHDIGRLNAGSIPLFRLIFKERKKLEPHKTIVVLVIRDFDKESSKDKVKEQLVRILEEIWGSVNPQLRLRDYIKFYYITFPPKTDEEEFKKKCTELRELVATGNLAGSRQHNTSASSFSYNAHRIWQDMRQNKQLDLPSYKEAYSHMKCNEVKNNLLASLESYGSFKTLIKDGTTNPQDFFKEMERLVELITLKYDKEIMVMDVSVPTEIRRELIVQIKQLLENPCGTMLKKYVDNIFAESKKEIGKALSNTELPTESVDSVIGPFLTTFDHQCQDLGQIYGASVTENREKLECYLRYFAVDKANKIQRNRVAARTAGVIGINLLKVALVGVSVVTGLNLHS